MIELTYGHFPGGDYDPRRFEPDREVNTPEEIAAWERACAQREAGVATIERPGCSFGAEGICCGSALGLGTYEIEVDDDPDDDGGEPMPVDATRAA